MLVDVSKIKPESQWTEFFDMSSGGGRKEDAGIIYIEAAREAAERIFFNKFGHNPHRVTCTCCGPDYSLSEYDGIEFLEEVGELIDGSGFNVEYRIGKGIRFIFADEITDDDREGDVPKQGYVWVD